MPISSAPVQSATQVDVAASSTTTPSITLTGTTGGNTLIGYCSIWDADDNWTISAVGDGVESFTLHNGFATAASSSRSSAGLAHAEDIAGGDSTLTFTLASTSAGSDRYYVLGYEEWSGVKVVSAEDAFDVNQEDDVTSAPDISAGPIDTTDNGALIVGVATVNSADTTLAFASPTNWTNTYRQNDSSAIIGMDAGYWLPGSIQTAYT